MWKPGRTKSQIQIVVQSKREKEKERVRSYRSLRLSCSITLPTFFSSLPFLPYFCILSSQNIVYNLKSRNASASNSKAQLLHHSAQTNKGETGQTNKQKTNKQSKSEKDKKRRERLRSYRSLRLSCSITRPTDRHPTNTSFISAV